MIEGDEILDYLRRQRWFARADEDAGAVTFEPLPWLTNPGEGVGVRFVLVTVAGPRHTQVYNVPLAYRREPVEENAYGFIGVRRADAVSVSSGDEVGADELYVYDALHDPQARQVMMRGFFAVADTQPPAEPPAEPPAAPAVEYVRRTDFGPGTDAPVGPTSGSVVLGVEQSNTSYVIDETAILKVFRKVVAGRNPDIEIHDALGGPGDEHIAALWGWITAPAVDDREHYDLAMLQRFLRTASNGWDSARASVRDLLADPSTTPEEAGGDFAGESERLGRAVASVHTLMEQRLDSATWGAEALERLRQRLDVRLEGVLLRAPELAPYAEAARGRYAAVTTVAVPVPAQRVHGDLHLGQTLRTTAGWKIIDFEGEPAAPLEARIALDSPLRDVAGMLRSFDYAAYSSLLQSGSTDNGSVEQADAWVSRNRDAFLTGYGQVAEELAPLLIAYEVDKALYEYVYERDHRPGWLTIPTAALRRLAA